ncbi:hypothetical protein [Mesorhizobium kowhaii]|uniref:hypothetical protein n=1 Tax=Mesorhizobium kowhaii TaxID=1300272 RepID=UPI0011B65A00|nr:hypothetical protein [Mesorhizobium kowhaii]
MPNEILASLISTGGTIIVAILAAAISYGVGRGMKTHEWRLGIVREKVSLRHRLYTEFLAEADRLVLQGLEAKTAQASAFHTLTARLSEVELIGSDSVVEAARGVCGSALASHAAADAEPKDAFYDIKRNFVSAVRREISEIEGPS